LTALLGDEMAAERGFSDLAWASQEHHFFGQVGLHTVIEVTFHSVILRPNEMILLKSRDKTI
jgi:hypothetical protein